MESPADPSSLSPGIKSIWGFSFFNAIAFQIALGAPVILYAKSLGATPTVLGVIASLTPLLTIVQIPAVYFLERVGYKKIILMGWGLRNLFTLLIALIPVAFFLENATKIVVLIVCLAGFNLMRGFASGAWLPWISELIPERIRGRFLSRDQQFLNLGCLAALLVSSVGLHGPTQPWQFTVVLLISFVAGAISLEFLKKMPDSIPQETMKSSAHPVPWKEMLTYPPFLRLIVFNVAFVVTFGSLGVFSIDFLRDRSSMSDSGILALNALTFLAALFALPFSGRLIDRAGSKLVLRVSLMMLGIVMILWVLQAIHVLSSTLWLVGSLYALTGLANSAFNIANVRLTMATMPKMGRNHFFALFTVISSLGLGLTPIVWGLVLDGLEHFHTTFLGMEWDEFALYYSLLGVLCVVTFFCASLVHEETPKGETKRDAEITGNMRRFWRLLQR